MKFKMRLGFALTIGKYNIHIGKWLDKPEKVGDYVFKTGTIHIREYGRGIVHIEWESRTAEQERAHEEFLRELDGTGFGA